MANTEIDSLSLNIAINGLSDRDIQNLESLANSIAKLQRNLRKLELSKLQDIKIPENVKGITGVTYDISPTFDLPEGFDEMFKDVEETFTQASDTMQSEIGKINTDVDKLKVSTKGLEENTKKALNPKKNSLNKQLNGIDKTLRRIKVVSFVKLIRGAINSLVRGLGDGIKNLAVFDKQFNETMSTLSTAKTQIFNSLALTISPFITSITPMITTISNGLVNISNVVSQITASLKGMSTYTRVNTKYMEDYAKSLQKAQGFSFDTFQSLNLQDSMFEEASVTEEEINKYADFVSIIQDLKDSFADIKDFVKDAFGTISTFFSDNVGNIKEIVSQSKEFTSIITGIGKISQFGNLFSSLSETILPSIINFVGKILKSVENIGLSVSPLVNEIVDDLLPALLELVDTILQPINTLLGDGIFPIVAELISEIAETLVPFIKLISSIIGVINLQLKPINQIISWIIDYLGGKLTSILKIISNLLSPILIAINTIAEVIKFIVGAIKSLWDLDFDSLAKLFKNMIANIARFALSLIDKLINSFVEFANSIIASGFVKDVLKFFGINDNWQGFTWRSNLAGLVPSFANGGIVGEVWQMNEYGNPEMLFNANNSGNTSVINVDQLSEAFERAIYNTGLLGAIEEGKVVYIDGRAIAQSRNFKNELNRTNPTLNIK